MAPKTRSEVLTIRVSPDEAKMLARLADVDGVYKSDVIRRLIRAEHRERFEGAATRKK